MPKTEQIAMGAMIALLCGFGLWHLRWLVGRTRKGQWLRERLGERRALWVFGGLLAAGIAFGALLATDVIRPVQW